MKDRSVEYPNRYRMTLVPGTTDIYEMTPVPGEVYEEGTLMSKANILDDNSEMDIWGTIGDRTPNDAFSFIGKSLVAHDKDIENLAADLEGKIVTGTYTGNGATSRTISLGFRPKVVYVQGIVTNSGYTIHDGGDYINMPVLANDGNPALYEYNTNYSFLTIVDSGFALTETTVNDYNGTAINKKSVIYIYFAIA